MDALIQEIGNLISRCDDALKKDWDSLSVVFDISEGVVSNSGFMYNTSKVLPMSSGIDGEPMAVTNRVSEFQAAVDEKLGQKFKQLLVQMERESGRIKIDFEFDDPKRWNMGPSNYIRMREELRPRFD